MGILLHRICCMALATGLVGPVWLQAQDTTSPETEEATISVAPPLVLDISRRTLKNFIQDETALERYKRADGSITDLEDAFTIGSMSGRYAVIWDATACRLAGILDVKPSPDEAAPAAEGDDPEPASPYVLLAEGYSPLTGSLGTFGHPVYFGFRLVDGQPEFLYTHGGLQVEERLWLIEEGRVLKVRFSVKNADNPILLNFPKSWKDRIVEVSAGTWRDHTLSVPAENAEEVVVSFRLEAESKPGEEG